MNLETALQQVVLARSHALIHGDAKRMNEILADEFTYTNARGQTISKRAYMENYVASPDVKWFAQEVSDLRIELYGEVGVVTCRVQDRAEFQGAPFEGTYRSLFVYVLREDAWRCVVGQTTEIKEE